MVETDNFDIFQTAVEKGKDEKREDYAGQVADVAIATSTEDSAALTSNS
jgi:hypothetical protein